MATTNPEVANLAWRLIRRLPSNIELDDLVQAANLRLIEVGHKINQSGNPQAYSMKHARGAMMDELRKTDPLSRHDRQMIKLISAARDELTRQGKAATASAIAGLMELEIDVPQVHRLLVLESMALSSVQAEEIGDNQMTDNQPTPEEACEAASNALALRQAIQELPERNRVVVDGLIAGTSQNDIARKLFVTKSRVSQLKDETFRMLRKDLSGRFGMAA